MDAAKLQTTPRHHDITTILVSRRLARETLEHRAKSNARIEKIANDGAESGFLPLPYSICP
jgi:hypothetical protein